jgi:hypothetical protein
MENPRNGKNHHAHRMSQSISGWEQASPCHNKTHEYILHVIAHYALPKNIGHSMFRIFTGTDSIGLLGFVQFCQTQLQSIISTQIQNPNILTDASSGGRDPPANLLPPCTRIVAVNFSNRTKVQIIVTLWAVASTAIIFCGDKKPYSIFKMELQYKEYCTIFTTVYVQ